MSQVTTTSRPTNPATGEVLADVASGGEAEINQAVAAAKEAFPKWANLPMKERARLDAPSGRSDRPERA
ncbi:5-carboxymethyl-2-hydroxymuconate semialdehyde dehydrogenase [Escherichia coli]|uniref:5-carboxymethyl-2-hydroxymuconate semialdehyde dehydrogenase n=1 Tax=Escherichia coli TaxID=562 RepID=A0A376L1Y8_ECOLX|nr:5-carboxymethyl-2-hydroxymuconate semialdehyde dehydrogenase [Escherichia coli]